jgi:uncharacterized membrane protein YgcG
MEYLKKFSIRKYEHLMSKTLMGIMIVLGGLLLMKATTVIVYAKTSKTKVVSAFETAKKNSNAMELYRKRSADEVNKVMEKNPFAPEAQKPQPPLLAGVMGDEVLVNGQWYKVGQEVSGAKILKIDPTFVMIDFGGKQQVLTPQTSVDPNAGRNQGQGFTRGGPGGMGGGPGGDRGGFGGRGGGRGGFGQFGNVSPDQANQMRERFMNMSPEERRNAFRQMRENVGNQDH